MGVGEEQACTALGTALKITGFNTFDIEAPAKGTNRCTADPPFSKDRMCHFASPQNVLPAPKTRQGSEALHHQAAFHSGVIGEGRSASLTT